MPSIIDSLNTQLNLIRYGPMNKDMEKMIMFYWTQIRWRHYRLILLGWIKNRDSRECLLSSLPREIIRILLGWTDYMLVYDQGDYSPRASLSNANNRINITLNIDNSNSNILFRYRHAYRLLYTRSLTTFIYKTRYNLGWLKIEDKIDMDKEYLLPRDEEIEVATESCAILLRRDITVKRVMIDSDPFEYCERLRNGSVKFDEDLIVVETSPSSHHALLFHISKCNLTFDIKPSFYSNQRASTRMCIELAINTCKSRSLVRNT